MSISPRLFSWNISLLVLVLALLSVAAIPRASASEGTANGALPGPAAASADQDVQPMVLARMRGTGQCGSRCPEWIMAQGIITPNTPRRLRDLLGQISPAKLPVVLDSRGGDLDAALEIGRMIRAAGLTTIIGRSEVEGCGPRDDCSGERTAGLAYQGFVSTPAECSGTCLFALAGGTQRIGFWSNGASLPALDHFKTRSHGTDAAKLIANYLADMGISAGLVVRLRSAGLTLDRPDLLHFALITGRERVEDFTGASICLGPSPADNCLLPEPAPPAVRMSSAPPRPEPRRPGRLIIWGALD